MSDTSGNDAESSRGEEQEEEIAKLQYHKKKDLLATLWKVYQNYRI